MLEDEGTYLPDHELIVTTVGNMIDIRCREEVIRNIGNDVAIAIAPLHRGRNALQIADKLLGEATQLRIGIALDLAAASGPVPGSRP